MTDLLDKLAPEDVGPLVRLAIARLQLRQAPTGPTERVIPEAVVPVGLVGEAMPRIAPPMPEADLTAFREAARIIGIRPLPWQEVCANYLEARTAEGRRLYREVALIVSRQNGKTTFLKPFIVRCLRDGLRVLHIAQNRDLPRAMFDSVASEMARFPELLVKRGRRVILPRYGSGQEEIRLNNGGEYRIAASNRGGARGRSVDVLIVDETRELVDDDVMAAAKPTQTAADDPVTLYLSNAGDDTSVVLNGIRQRAQTGEDPRLAWLEWSAEPGRDAGDRGGWAEANPSLGHFPNMLAELESAYLAATLEGKVATFETEHLCRWVPTMREPLVALDAWARCQQTELPEPVRPFMAVSMDPAGKRASVALAWRLDDDRVALRLLMDVTGDPVSTDKLGRAIKEQARIFRAASVGFDPMTDTALSRYVERTQSISASSFANASARFVSAIESGTLRWSEAGAVSTDLLWTARKENEERGSFEAVRGRDDRPITAALAAIRAVWLASRPNAAERKPRLAVGF